MKSKFNNFLASLIVVVLFILFPTITLYASNSPLCFTAKGGTVTVSFDIKNVTHTIQYSTDSTNWQSYSSNTTILLNANEKVFFRAATNQTTAISFGAIINMNWNCSHFNFTTANGGTIEASGNIMSLYGPDCPNLALQSYAFTNLFLQCDILTTTPSLPAISLANYCYYRMFKDCISLTSTSSLPATILASDCYSSMFQGCTSLITAPSLPATTLAYSCYSNMFDSCSSLTTAPSLPATTLTEFCYSCMFRGCTSITTVPSLPATILANNCYSSMFNGCTSLTAVSSLPATTLANGCYGAMFYGCSSLTKMPSLPAITLPENCYFRMFKNCTSLIVNNSSPGKPWKITATSVLSNALKEMFDGTSGNVNGTPCANTTYYIASDTSHSPTYIITALSDDSTMGYVTGGGQYDYGDTATLTAIPLSGYRFTHWNNGDTNSVKSFSVFSDSVFTAYFEQIPAEETYLNFVAVGGPATVKLTNKSTHTYINLQYSTDECNSWNTYSIDQVISLTSGSKVYFRTVSTSQLFSTSSTDYYNFEMTGKVSADGNIMSLLYKDIQQTYVPSYAFYSLFENCESLTTAPLLPATSLSEGCYHNMFEGCTSLILPPSLPATTLAEGCYNHMFSGCTSLVTLPDLLARTLPNYCYYYMFSYCTSLFVNHEAPGKPWSIPASTAPSFGVSYMLYGTSGTMNYTPALGNTVYYIASDPSYEVQYTVTAAPNNSSRGTVSGGGQYKRNETATLTATPKAGCFFTRWSNGETSDTINITVTGDVTLTAYFETHASTAVDDVDDADAVVLAPNPIHVGEVTYIDLNGTECNGTTIEVLNAAGNCVRRFEATSTTVVIDGFNAAGTYLIRIMTGTGEAYIRKLIVH